MVVRVFNVFCLWVGLLPRSAIPGLSELSEAKLVLVTKETFDVVFFLARPPIVFAIRLGTYVPYVCCGVALACLHSQLVTL